MGAVAVSLRERVRVLITKTLSITINVMDRNVAYRQARGLFVLSLDIANNNYQVFIR